MTNDSATVVGMPDPLKILYEDNHLLVIDKPATLATMGAEPGEPSLVALAKDYVKFKYNKPGNVYLGVVSRLDSFVTGVIVLARTSKAASRLNDQFRRRSVDKTYWAIVADPLPSEEETLEHYVFKNDVRHRMEVLCDRVVTPVEAKLAKLRFRKIGHRSARSLLEIKLDTGRKHQIRVQLEAIGCPIVGDQKYGSEVPFKQGIALHSRSLSFDHPTTKERLGFSVAPPSWWQIGSFELLDG